MTRLIITSIVLLNLFGCANKNHVKDSSQKTNTINTEKPKQVKVNNFDTLVIDTKTAVFYSPDTIQIAKRKIEVGEENFYVDADDYLNYMHSSQDYLDSVKMPILDAKNKKYLKFIFFDKTQKIIKLDTLSELWGIYLFNPIKKEKLVNMTVIDEEYKDYFN